MARPTVTEIDLSACDREPIHLLGSIQPHGVLLAFSEEDLTLRVVSANCERLLGRAPQEVLGRRLEAVLPPALLSAATQALDSPTAWPVRLEQERSRLTAQVHHMDGLAVLELEPAPPGESSEGVLAALERGFSRSGNARGLRALLQGVAEQVRSLTGYDRVMVYRFDEDWHGEVVAESVAEGVRRFLGLHFPASDIPAQARALYTSNRLRIIADVAAEPVPLVPAVLPALGRPLDLSCSSLRSVSTVHLQYLSNMEVQSSFSVSLIKDGRLWGLIACHHRSPLHVPAALRRACDLLARLLVLQLEAEERSARIAELADRTALRAQLIDRLSHYPQGLGLALVRYHPLLLQLAQAGGAALLLGDSPVLVGRTPPLALVKELARWLAEQPALGALFHTDRLGQLHPPLAAYADVASGLLVIRLEPETLRFLMWFRPEVARTVSWAGDPHKPVQLSPPDARRVLHPRASFEVWKETVRGRSLPWSWVDLEAVEGLRGGLVSVLFRQADALARYSAELESFSGTVAHELKESLRGILWSVRLLHEECCGNQAAGQQRLQEVEWNVGRTRQMLDALFEYSRWDNVERMWGEADQQALVEEVLRSLANLYTESGVEVRIPRRLPKVACDVTRLRQVWSNLLSNAAKYQKGPERWVEVGYYAPGELLPKPGPRRPEEHAFYVRDNGIGIPERFHETIFAMFRRLHPAHAYGGGSGAGLAIARRLVRAHGGELWVESAPGQGSTFYFTPGHEPR